MAKRAPQNVGQAGPAKGTNPRKLKGNPTKKGKIFGNKHNCSFKAK